MSSTYSTTRSPSLSGSEYDTGSGNEINLETVFSTSPRTDTAGSCGYSRVICEHIDPRTEEQSRRLRSGLVFPANCAVTPHKYQKLRAATKTRHFSSHFKAQFVKTLFRCHLCSETYLNQQSLDRHLNMRHLRHQATPEARFFCKKCSKEFTATVTPRPNNRNGQAQVSHICSGDSKCDVFGFSSNVSANANTHSNSKKSKSSGVRAENNSPNLQRLYSASSASDSSRLLMWRQQTMKRTPFDIKRVRYECRTNCNLPQIEQWLKYELNRKCLAHSDYLDCARMFIAIQGYDLAAQLVNEAINRDDANHKDGDKSKDRSMEYRLLQTANSLRNTKQSI